MEPEIKGGLQPLPKDSRDFQLGAIVDLPALSELPPEYVVGTPDLNQQMNSDFCPLESSSSVSELQEGVKLCPEWGFAVGKKIAGGDVDSFGLDLRSAAKVQTSYGLIEAKDAPYSLEKGQSVEFLRRIENWPEELFTKALAHKKGSFFAVTGPYDAFDNLRASIFKFKDEKCGFFFGVLWNWPLSQVIMDTIPTFGSGHALCGLGWKIKNGIPYIYTQNSYGPQAGENGRHYFSREVINAFADTYGLYMFHDMPKETAQHYLAHGIKIGDNWLTQLWKVILNAWPWRKSSGAGSANPADTSSF